MTGVMRAVGFTEFGGPDVLGIVSPAERAAQAHRRFEAHGVRGRLVLTF